MKKANRSQTTANLIILGCILILGGNAYAETGALASPTEAGYNPQNKQNRFHKFLEKHPDLKTKLDLNGDGVLDENERSEAREKFKEQRQVKLKKRLAENPELLKKIDTNGDGTVDEAERKSARTKWKEKRGEKLEQFYEKHPKLAEKADTNGDGTIDKTERKQARKIWRENKKK